jgi:hypothetical protein
VATQGGGEGLTGPARLSAPMARGCAARPSHLAGPGADLGAVLGEGGVAEVVQAVLDRPVPAQVVGEPGGAGLGEGAAGDRLDSHRPPPPGGYVAGLAGDLEDLRGVREAEEVHGDSLERAQLHAAVGAVAGAVQDGDAVPGKALAAVQQRGLVGLDPEQLIAPGPP